MADDQNIGRCYLGTQTLAIACFLVFVRTSSCLVITEDKLNRPLPENRIGRLISVVEELPLRYDPDRGTFGLAQDSGDILVFLFSEAAKGDLEDSKKILVPCEDGQKIRITKTKFATYFALQCGDKGYLTSAKNETFQFSNDLNPRYFYFDRAGVYNLARNEESERLKLFPSTPVKIMNVLTGLCLHFNIAEDRIEEFPIMTDCKNATEFTFTARNIFRIRSENITGEEYLLGNNFTACSPDLNIENCFLSIGTPEIEFVLDYYVYQYFQMVRNEELDPASDGYRENETYECGIVDDGNFTVGPCVSSHKLTESLEELDSKTCIGNDVWKLLDPAQEMIGELDGSIHFEEFCLARKSKNQVKVELCNKNLEFPKWDPKTRRIFVDIGGDRLYLKYNPEPEKVIWTNTDYCSYGLLWNLKRSKVGRGFYISPETREFKCLRLWHWPPHPPKVAIVICDESYTWFDREKNESSDHLPLSSQQSPLVPTEKPTTIPFTFPTSLTSNDSTTII